MIGRAVLRGFREQPGDEAEHTFIAALDVGAPAGGRASRRRLDQRVDRRDADVLEGDDEQAPPYPVAAQPVERDRRPFGQIGVAAADRLLEQRRSEKSVDREGLGDHRPNRVAVVGGRSASSRKQITHVRWLASDYPCDNNNLVQSRSKRLLL
ncbi:MAG: hypothetical protein ABR878_16785 [Roseiarcus sp.]